MLVIADSSQPIAIAGVMGGQATAIHAGTEEIIVEAANFEAVSVRKTAGKLGIRTDSSLRFEKSLDPTLAESGLRRFLFLVKKVCKAAEASSSLTDISSFKLEQGPISIPFGWIDDKAGQAIPHEKSVNILEKLGFGLEVSDTAISTTIPTWRAAKDIAIAEDILEEILRVFGYDQIISQDPIAPINPPVRLLEKDLAARIQDFLSGAAALTEAYNYSFSGESSLNKLGIDTSSFLRLANPLSSEYALLRQSLVPGLLGNVRLNQFNYEDVRLFEVGRIFLDTPGVFYKGNDSKEVLPYQGQRVAIVLSGKGNDYFPELKGMIEQLANRILNGAWEVEFAVAETFPAFCESKQSVRIRVNGHDLGFVASVSKKAASSFGLKVQAAVAEINFEELAALAAVVPAIRYRETPKYPPVVRDLAFVVDTEIMYNDIRKEMLAFDSLVSSVELFDSYQGEKLGAGKKNLAFHITYQSDSRTLTSDEIDGLQEKLSSTLSSKFGAKLRDF